MAPSAQAHNRSHSLLLLQKLLNLRDSASPLTLILDSLEQSAQPLLREFIDRAKIARSKIVFVSFATVKKPRDADFFVKGRGKSLDALRSEIAAHCPPPSALGTKDGIQTQKVLIVIDSLNSLASSEPHFLSAFLSAVITPLASVVVVYHTDVPLVLPATFGEYEPHPLAVLSHLATCIFRVESLYQAAERRRAQNRSLPEPEFGLHEGREGVLVGLRSIAREKHLHGIVIKMEMRRRSGRAVSENFVLAPKLESTGMGLASIKLLSDHPVFAAPEDAEPGPQQGEGQEIDATFNLGLTDKQRKDREGIVLPYFDAQTDIGAGEGGRILYDMGREDDFDEEEDEI
ncbi:hypothetical protein GQ53DRAFT_748768 [Thozetella sp. PMI_491]|nr:hypothetical protein GQ53DRAFT_748768 [Thozetella sp. PMI_491]